jgi:4-amino-4-deoxy-L-arabinose transferase-like glycosyltransferase
MIIKGYAPHVQVFSSQPAHFVLILATFFKLFGMSIVSARLFIVITSIVAIMSTYLIAKRIEDWKAGVVAAFLLSVGWAEQR